MKKSLVLLLISFIGTVGAYYPNNQVIFNFDSGCTPYNYNNPYYYGDPCYQDHGHYHHYESCLPSERFLRKQLYWLYLYNPRLLETAEFPIDYFINSLTDHIKVLEYKILQKRSGWASNAMLRGGIISVFAAVWGCSAYDLYKKSIKKGKSQEVGAVVMMSAVTALLAAIAGTQFDKVYHHAERLRDRLERDKRILVALENIKFSRA